jgi:hypothetical protein
MHRLPHAPRRLTRPHPKEKTVTTYLIEFGTAWPVPPITVDFIDRTTAARVVAEHAIPHLRPVLEAKGHPEYADCFFTTNRELTHGAFMWADLAEGMTARFCPARLTPADSIDPDLCGAQDDTEVCDLDPGHDGDHCDTNANVSWPAAPAPTHPAA